MAVLYVWFEREVRTDADCGSETGRTSRMLGRLQRAITRSLICFFAVCFAPVRCLGLERPAELQRKGDQNPNRRCMRGRREDCEQRRLRIVPQPRVGRTLPDKIRQRDECEDHYPQP